MPIVSFSPFLLRSRSFSELYSAVCQAFTVSHSTLGSLFVVTGIQSVNSVDAKKRQTGFSSTKRLLRSWLEEMVKLVLMAMRWTCINVDLSCISTRLELDKNGPFSLVILTKRRRYLSTAIGCKQPAAYKYVPVLKSSSFCFFIIYTVQTLEQSMCAMVTTSSVSTWTGRDGKLQTSWRWMPSHHHLYVFPLVMGTSNMQEWIIYEAEIGHVKCISYSVTESCKTQAVTSSVEACIPRTIVTLWNVQKWWPWT